MLRFTYDEIVQKIRDEKGLSLEEISQRISEKLKKLSDLVSKEGAAHILANELGIKLFEPGQRITLNKLQAGRGNVSFYCKVLKIYEVRSFVKEGKEGKVVSMLVGDEWGMTRLVFWDTNHISLVESEQIIEGTILSLKQGYVRDNNGYLEVHLGNKGSVVINPEDVVILLPEKKERASLQPFVKKRLSELVVGDSNVGCFGTLVQLFDIRFYEACGTCGKKLQDQKCVEHGEGVASQVPLLSFY